jgi:uncharacterized repeat protein (TIGR01451 family)
LNKEKKTGREKLKTNKKTKTIEKGILTIGIAALVLFVSVGAAMGEANLNLSKVGGGYIGNWHPMGYSLYYQNLGQSEAQNVILVDMLPLDLEFVDASNGGTYDPVNRTVIWNIGTVPANSERYQIWVTARVPIGVPVGTVVRNNAMISTTDIESDYSDNSANATTTVLPPGPANLHLTKTGPISARGGTEITYTLNYANWGEATVSNIRIIDALPLNTDFVSASNGGFYDLTNRRVIWDLGSMVGYFTSGSVTVTVRVQAGIPVGTIIQNTATISTSDPETDYSDNSASANTTARATLPANLQLSKTGPINAFNGTQITYVLNASNSGGYTASNATLTDTLPLNVDFVSASNSGIYDPINRTVTWILLRLPNYGYRSRIITVQIPANVPVGTVIENTAMININATEIESNYGDNNASAITTVIRPLLGTNLQVSKTGPVKMDRGNPMTYTIYYGNVGDTAASNVTISDTLPLGVEFVSASGDYSYDPATRNVTQNLDIIGAYPGGYGSMTVTVRILTDVPVGTVIVNTASINTTDIETEYSDNMATVSTTVTVTSLPVNVSLEPTTGISGGVPSVHWTSPETFGFNSPCATGVDISIHLNDGGSDITSSMTEISQGVWAYTATFYPRRGSATVTYSLAGCEETSVVFNIYIDPAGYIYDSVSGERIAGASIWLQQPDGVGGWQNVSIGQDPAVMQPDVNPLTTNAEGQYQWDVLPGIYRVHVEALGYYPQDSIEVSIPPPVTDLHVGLIRIPVLDNTPPSITIDTPTSTNYILNQSVLANWQAIDLESGISSVSATAPYGSLVDTGTVGQKTFTVSAIDKYGNEASKTVNYNVIYNFSGILQPINADNSSVFKLKSTVPIKFQLNDSNGNYITTAIARIYIAKISDGVVGTDIEAVSTNSATTGNQFRYDTTANQYIFNLATKSLSKGTWQIRIELDDETSKYINLSLK